MATSSSSAKISAMELLKPSSFGDSSSDESTSKSESDAIV